MALLNRRRYEKAEPFRDAVIYFVICEGEKREPDYFEFFDRLTHQLKVIPIASKAGESAPNHLEVNAEKAVKKWNIDEGDYELWFVLDIDRWQEHIHKIQKTAGSKKNWFIAISNPCFEVWLYYHFEKKKPQMDDLNNCQCWKQVIPQIKEGGFDSSKHPTLIHRAIENAKHNYSGAGYIPDVGSTQLYELGQKLYEKTRKVLMKYE